MMNGDIEILHYIDYMYTCTQ